MANKTKGSNLSQHLVKVMKSRHYMNLAVTPEGTRSRTAKWRKGFLYIAIGAGVPVQLGVIDYLRKKVTVREEFMPTGDVEADMKFVKDYYRAYADVAFDVEKFTVSDD